MCVKDKKTINESTKEQFWNHNFDIIKSFQACLIKNQYYFKWKIKKISRQSPKKQEGNKGNNSSSKWNLMKCWTTKKNASAHWHLKIKSKLILLSIRFSVFTHWLPWLLPCSLTWHFYSLYWTKKCFNWYTHT